MDEFKQWSDNSHFHCCACRGHNRVRLVDIPYIESHEPTRNYGVATPPPGAYGYIAVLRVENVGTGVARNVKFMGDLSRSVDGKTKLKEIGFVKNGIAVFGPGQNIDHYFFGTLEIPEALKPVPFELIVTYSDSSEHHKNRRTFRLDFSECEGPPTTSGSPLHEIAKTLKVIQKDLHKLTR